MKLILLLILIGTGCCQAQTVFYKVEDFLTQEGQSVNKVKPALFNPKILHITDSNGLRKYVSSNSIWGFKNEDGEVYRVYRNDFYRVIEVGPLMVYSHDLGKTQQTCFSVDPARPIIPLSKRALVREAKNNSCMRVIKSKLNESGRSMAVSAKSGQNYLINSVIKETGCNPFQ